MIDKATAGWGMIALACLIPVILLFALGPAAVDLDRYANFTHVLGQVSGLIGMTLFSITFVLSSRIKAIEDIFGGLDKVYRVHAMTGGLALVLLLFHPLFLVMKFIPQDMKLAAIYLLPSGFWAVDMGMIALAGMILLLVLTFYSRMRYDRWKISHTFLGLVFLFAVLHVFLVRGNASRDEIFTGYYLYASFVSLIGAAGLTYTLIMKSRLVGQAMYRIKSIDRKEDGICDLIITPVYKPITFLAGQFIFLRFYNRQTGRESHPFSIASGSDSKEIRIIIKNLGDFTSNLGGLKVGDRLGVEGPYGRFNSLGKKEDQVWIAAGIGVTPFIGMAEDVHHRKTKGKVDMFYTVSDTKDLISLDFLKKVQKDTPNFTLIPWVTKEKGRLTVDAMMRQINGVLEKDFFICGPDRFKESIKEQLISKGILKKNIFSEEFSFR